MEDSTAREASGTVDGGQATEPATTAPGTIRCDQCGETVPDLTYCVRCGDPLGPEQRKGRPGRVRDTYAAVPGERANSLHLVSTIYPSLPREEIRTFQIALVAGAILIALLGILGFFPVAIVAAAVLVPLITIIYLYDVDVYEDEPLRVVAATFLWGLVTGALFAFAVARLFPVTATDIVGGSAVDGAGGGTPFPFVRGVVGPIIAVVLMIAGPAVLLPYRRFNDVLDGATFGVASGVAFIGAQTLVTSVSLFASGLQPVGDPLPWVVRLLILGVGMPVVAAGAIGGLAGALWLRYRAPVKDRARLGPVGQPVVAFVIAAALLVVASLAELLLPDQLVPQLVVLGVVVLLAIVALLWLRRVIHLGLLQEASEIPIGPDIACPECGKPTPFHTYCGSCGVSLKALPRTRHREAAAAVTVGDINAPHRVQPGTPDVSGGPTGVATGVVGGSAIAVEPPRSHGWLHQRAVLALFAVALLGAVLIAAAYAATQGQKRDLPPCPDPTLPCAGVSLAQGPSSLATFDQDTVRHPFADRVPYRDEALGFSLEYDPTIWSVASQDAGFLVLSALGGNVALIFEGTTADRLTPQQLLDGRSSLMADRLLGFTEDTDPARQLLGDPILGYRDAVARLSGGTVDSGQGPTIDMTVATVVGTDGGIVVAATVVTPVELTIQRGDEQVTLPIREAGLQFADSVVNSFTWPADEVVQ